jgi:hypothetical protein
MDSYRNIKEASGSFLKKRTKKLPPGGGLLAG